MFFRKVSRNYQFVLLVVLGVALCRSLFSFYFSCGSVTNTNRQRTLDYIKHSTSDILDFEGFDNNSTKPGRPLIVPNIVHFIFLNTTRVKFHEMICIFAAYLNQRPDTIMIHCEDCNFKGKYWDQLYSVGPLRRIMQIKKLPVKRGLYGRIAPNNRYIMAHRADLWRVQILSQYGGMYLDNDAYVVNSIDKYRVFEMTVGLENTNGVTLGNQILIAHKNARMLKAWTDMYRYDYRENEWFYNGGYVPGLIVRNSSYLVHLEPTRLGMFSLLLLLLLFCLIIFY